MGQTSYIFEVGSGLVIDGEVEWLTGGLEPNETGNIFEQIEAAGVPALLLEEFDDRLEYHAPWHINRDVSHLFRGVVDTEEIDVVPRRQRPRSPAPDRQRPHPPQVREAQVRPAERLPPDPHRRRQGPGVARHMQIRGYARDEVIACGDSREDLEVAPVVDEFFLMRNAVICNPDLADRSRRIRERDRHRGHPRQRRLRSGRQPLVHADERPRASAVSGPGAM